jgi:transcriptional repressor of cell division inhibition gene dicB
MTTSDAVKHYGTQTKLAKALGIEQGSVSGWGEFPPPLRQLQIERLSKGKLRAEPNIFSKKRAA